MKLAITTLIDIEYSDLALTMLYSLVKNNPLLEFDFIVFTWESLSSEIISKFNKIHPTIIKPIPTDDYTDCLIPKNKWRTWNYNPFLKFEIFGLSEYEKVIYIDSDVLVIDSIDEFVKFPYDIYACEMTRGTGMEFVNTTKTRFNAGILGIGSKFLNDKIRHELIKVAELQPWSGNQTPLNIYFQDSITYVDSKYNLQTDQFTSDSLTTSCMIHFIGSVKPNKNLHSMSMSYEEAQFETSSIHSLYIAWQLFVDYYIEMEYHVSK